MAEKFSDYALAYINALGGKDNIDTLINCATRIRVTVKNPSLVAADSEFKNWGGNYSYQTWQYVPSHCWAGCASDLG